MKTHNQPQQATRQRYFSSMFSQLLGLFSRADFRKRHVQRPMKLLASYRRALDKYRLYEQRSDDLEAGRGWARHGSYSSANRTGARV